MDFVWLLDWIGEGETLLIVGLAFGLAFGVLAQRTGFCTRSAIIDAIEMRGGSSFSLWAIALTTAIFGTQALTAAGMIDLTETRFFSSAQSVSGAMIGGVMFGAGMIFARGCVSRLVVLGASGNLRAVASTILIAIVAFATIDSISAPVRSSVTSLASTALLGTNNTLAVAGVASHWGAIVAAVALATAVLFGFRTQIGALRCIAGVAIGLLIPAGWFVTYQLSQQVFEPIQPMSLNFISPLSNLAGFAGDGDAARLYTVEVGVIAGTIAGAFIAALLSRDLKLEHFGTKGSAPVWRYGAGSVLMGFGGVLASGCTIGAGFTGGSALAFTALIALISIIAGAAATHRLLDGASTPLPIPVTRALLTPAE